MKGNEAIGEAAVRAGCRHFFGYPITPQSEVPEYLAKRFPEVGGTFLQAESEVSASNMLYGAAGMGIRVLTTSSSPGISLMAEGISYIAACELPCVLVNIVRAGPGLGGILPAQSDYLQATKGMAHGDFKLLVLGPSSVQEAVNLIILAFDLADKYRNPVIVVGDGMIGQMMEPVDFPAMRDPSEFKPPAWALTGAKGREKQLVNSLYLDPDECNQHNLKLAAKYRVAEKYEQRWETYKTKGKYDILVTAYGMMSRIARTAIDSLAKEGIKCALFRPISLWPFPYMPLRKAAEKAKLIFDTEMSMGQMLEDIKLAVLEKKPVEFFGTAGGIVPSPEEVADKLREYHSQL